MPQYSLALIELAQVRQGLAASGQHDVAVGVQRSFAETVDAYIECKLAEE